jgi:hypothetical protein
MMFSKQKYIFIFPLLLIITYGCGYMPLQNTNIKINYNISQDLPKDFKAKLLAIPNHEESSKLEVSVSSYDFKKYEVFGGVAIRSLEGELKLSVDVSISSENNIIKTKNFVTIKRYKTNELNPFSQNEAVKLLKDQMEDSLIEQIMLEVNLIEM